MGSATDDLAILVVDDEQTVADAYALRLPTEYGDVRNAHGGEEAPKWSTGRSTWYCSTVGCPKSRATRCSKRCGRAGQGPSSPARAPCPDVVAWDGPDG